MNSNLQLDFLVDKVNKTLIVKREFAAEPELVWAAYTKSELLEQWFAPKPWRAVTKHMDFSEGGHWLYAMIGPDGEEHWGRMDYLKIDPITSYNGIDCFCDSEGTVNEALPQANWQSTFTELQDHTLIETVVSYPSLEQLETVLQMGMKEGLTMAMEGLDEVLLNLPKNA